MDISLLRKIGLSEGEIKIYSALLELGNSQVNKIHEKIGMERRNIYDILNKLIEKGLVNYTQENKKRRFNVTHPSKIIGYIEEKKKDLVNIGEEVEIILPKLIEKFSTKKIEITSETFRGAEGIKAVWEDMLNYREARWIGSGNYVPTKFPAFFASWNKRRIKNNIKSYHLFRHEMRDKLIKNIGSVKILPLEFSGNPTVTVIYGYKVAQFLFGENLFVFVIESKELAENYRRYFQYLWDKVGKD